MSKILPPLYNLLKSSGKAVCLIKPQFEAGKEKVGKKGVVRDISVHREVVENVTAFMLENGFSVLGLEFSPIKGPEGNIEYLAFLEKSDSPIMSAQISPEEIVKLSHDNLS